MARITDVQLNALINRLNTDNPGTKYLIDNAYGDVSLNRYAAIGSLGEVDVLGTGKVPKKELYFRILAYIDGINEGIRRERALMKTMDIYLEGVEAGSQMRDGNEKV